ncbi:hypothetical protein [Adhaeribacter soli]|uniref:Uncharacterized protein n=1 Tax=Adhaeribacter soli TaxID=2607655 RepID=A0A5N1ISS3_9BACT|nr:hypothetical protein [Adhaeribacter soli]KAA9331160.1 hypothetical protein F0P94_14800 [Adhaeribacter soli]
MKELRKVTFKKLLKNNAGGYFREDASSEHGYFHRWFKEFNEPSSKGNTTHRILGLIEAADGKIVKALPTSITFTGSMGNPDQERTGNGFAPKN